MRDMANWLTTRDACKRAIGINGSDRDTQIDRIIESMSRHIERRTKRYYIPRTETHFYRWPQHAMGRSYWLWLEDGGQYPDLIAVDTLQGKAQDDSPTSITNYFLEPNGADHATRIEIDESSNDSFESGQTSQRSISVAGRWAYSEETESAGTLDGTISDSATTIVCSDASQIDVGHTLLIEDEQVFVRDRAFAALDSILIDGALTADLAETTITVDNSHGIQARETIRVDSERMFVESVSGNDLTVVRAYEGSTLASHSDNTAVHINRTLTVRRGMNGTTAASHSDGVAISKYVVPGDIEELCLAKVLAAYSQEQSAWGRVEGQGDNARELSGRALAEFERSVIQHYRRNRGPVAV